MGHVVLLGDSIFDNASYVPGGQPVVEQVRTCLPSTWRTSLLAVDGNLTRDVEHQLDRLPSDATHLFVSVGGNDALGANRIPGEPAQTVAEALSMLGAVQEKFGTAYRSMLILTCATKRSVAVCTVYDSVPGLSPAQRAALAGFNEIILREAFRAKLPVLDLRLVCNQHSDYSDLSPIEPSALGGMKIAQVVATVATSHDFERGRSAVFS